MLLANDFELAEVILEDDATLVTQLAQNVSAVVTQVGANRRDLVRRHVAAENATSREKLSFRTPVAKARLARTGT